MKNIYSIRLIVLLSIFFGGGALAKESDASKDATSYIPPKGLMLNLDFHQVKDGLILSKSLFPLNVPVGKFNFREARARRVLMIDSDETLYIPHSSLLDPHNGTWISSIQIYSRTNGVVVSQCDQTDGYVIYIADGIVHAAIHNKGRTIVLREAPGCGLGKMFKKRVTIVLKITPENVFLTLNRNLVAYVKLNHPFSAKNAFIQIGKNKYLPKSLQKVFNMPKEGFSGAVVTFKIISQ